MTIRCWIYFQNGMWQRQKAGSRRQQILMDKHKSERISLFQWKYIRTHTHIFLHYMNSDRKCTPARKNARFTFNEIISITVTIIVMVCCYSVAMHLLDNSPQTDSINNSVICFVLLNFGIGSYGVTKIEEQRKCY